MIFTDDPLRDFERHSREQEEALDSLPHCVMCGEPIQEYGYEFEDGWWCEDCVEDHRRRVY